MSARLLCAVPLPSAVEARALADFDAVTSRDGQMAAPDMLAALAQDDGLCAVLVSSRVRFDGGTIGMLPRHVRLIATCSAGHEHIDVAAAAARGILVSNTPDVVSEATADMALFLMLGALRRGREYAAIMERGWRQRFGLHEMLGHDLHGKTLGIVGMGRIGQAVARRAHGFGVRVLYHNRRRLPRELEGAAVYAEDLDTMLRGCHVLSLHLPGGAALDGMIDAKKLALLPRGAVLVNTARGTLVDEDALIAALRDGQLGAAGLDVFRREPEYDLRLRDLPNVFMMPHMGTATVETRNAMGHRALDNVADVLAGRLPRDAVCFVA